MFSPPEVSKYQKHLEPQGARQGTFGASVLVSFAFFALGAGLAHLAFLMGVSVLNYDPKTYSVVCVVVGGVFALGG